MVFFCSFTLNFEGSRRTKIWLKFRKQWNPHLNLISSAISSDLGDPVIKNANDRIVLESSHDCCTGSKSESSLVSLENQVIPCDLFGSVQLLYVRTICEYLQEWCLFSGMCRLSPALCPDGLLLADTLMPTKSRIVQTSVEMCDSLLYYKKLVKKGDRKSVV